MSDAFGRLEERLDKFSDELIAAGKEHAGFSAWTRTTLEELVRRIGILNGTVPEHTIQIAQKAGREEIAELRKTIDDLAAIVKADRERQEGAKEVKTRFAETFWKPFIAPLIVALILAVGGSAVMSTIAVNNAVKQIQNSTKMIDTTTTTTETQGKR